jgi:hypothetical protein
LVTQRTLRLILLLLAVCSLACLPAGLATATPSVDPHGAPSSTPTTVLDTTPTPTAAPTATLTPTELPPMEITVFFTDVDAYAAGTPPYEVPVLRLAPPAADSRQAVLTEFFAGPTAEEEAEGLVAITSGATGYSALQIDDGIARLYLTGQCNSGGATYTVAQPLMANLLQFEEIDYVKIYDETGETEQPEGHSNSIPFCLEP